MAVETNNDRFAPMSLTLEVPGRLARDYSALVALDNRDTPGQCRREAHPPPR